MTQPSSGVFPGSETYPGWQNRLYPANDVFPADTLYPNVGPEADNSGLVLDITVELPRITAGQIIDLDVIDITTEIMTVAKPISRAISAIDVTVTPLGVTFIRTSYGVPAIDITTEVLKINAGAARNLNAVDITTEITDIDSAIIYDVSAIDVVTQPVNVTVVQTSYSVGAIDITVDSLSARAARGFSAAPIDITTEILDAEIARGGDIDPIDIEIETPFTTVSQTSYLVLPIDISVQTLVAEVDHDTELDAIDITTTVLDIDPAKAKTIGIIDTTTQLPVVTSFNSHRVGIIDVTIETTAVDVANLADINAIDVTVQPATPLDLEHVFDVSNATDITVVPQPVVTYFSKRVGAIDTTVEVLLVKPAKIVDVDPVDITIQPAGPLDLEKIADLNRLSVITSLLPVSTQLFDDTPIQIGVEVLPVSVAFSVERFSYHRKLPVPAFVQSARVIAQDIITKRFLHWELPVSNLSITYTLSGAQVINGEFSNEILDLKDVGLEPWGTWIHVEQNGSIRASGILQPTSLDDAETLTLEAVGVSAYPAGQPFDEEYTGTFLDPADIVRRIWTHLQSFPDAKFGVTVTGSTTVKLGKPLPPAPPNPLPENYVEPANVDDKPYSLLWWEAPDCGDEINQLAQETPFDFVERNVWNSNKTDVLHYIDIGFPRIGTRQTGLSITQGENLIKPVGPEETDDFYASQVILLGKGEGRSMIRGYAGRRYKNRVRRTVILDDPTVDNVQRANALCAKELDRRQALLDVKEVEIDALHSNASLGSFIVGDDIQLIANVPWQGEINQWERVLSYTYYPDDEVIRAQLQRSESFVYGTGATT